jgi:hypothetical protein
MITLPNPADQQAVLDAISSREGYSARLGLLIGGEDFSTTAAGMSRLLYAEWGQSDIPITLDATLGGNLPFRYDGADVELYVQVEGRLIPQLFSKKMAFVATQGGWNTTEFLASTAGSLLNGDDAIKLGGTTPTDYPGMPPENIAWDILSRMPYSSGLVRVQPLGSPTITYAKQGPNPGFKPNEPLGAVLDRLAKDANYKFRDTALNGHVAARPLVLGADTKYVRELDARDFPKYATPAQVLPRYFDVVVYTELKDGTYAYKPVVAEVPYTADRLARRPYPGQTLYISLEDVSDDAADNAEQLAYDTALLYGRGFFDVPAVDLPGFEPLIETEDPYLINEPRLSDDGWHHIRWGWKITSYKGDYAKSTSGGLLTTNVTASAVLLSDEIIESPSLLLPLLSGGVYSGAAPYGFSDGFWVDPAPQEPLIIDIDEVNGLWVDEEAAHGTVGFDETNGLWVDI